MSPLTNLAIIGVEGADAGAASGLVNATHQIGCSLGLSIMVNSSAHFKGARTGRRRIAPQAIRPVGCCLARGFQRVGMSTVEAVNRKISWLFLFFWQSLHTFAHLLHTLQKSHEFFASLAQRVFRCTKKKILREEHPRQLAAFLCVHLPDGFKDHFTRDFCCHRRFVFRGFLRLCTGHIPSSRLLTSFR